MRGSSGQGIQSCFGRDNVSVGSPPKLLHHLLVKVGRFMTPFGVETLGPIASSEFIASDCQVYLLSAGWRKVPRLETHEAVHSDPGIADPSGVFGICDARAHEGLHILDCIQSGAGVLGILRLRRRPHRCLRSGHDSADRASAGVSLFLRLSATASNRKQGKDDCRPTDAAHRFSPLPGLFHESIREPQCPAPAI